DALERARQRMRRAVVEAPQVRVRLAVALVARAALVAEDRERARVRRVSGFEVVGVRGVEVDVRGVRRPEVVDAVDLVVGTGELEVVRQLHRAEHATLATKLESHPYTGTPVAVTAYS